MKSAVEISEFYTKQEIEEKIAFFLDQPQSDRISQKALEVLSDALEIIESRTR